MLDFRINTFIEVCNYMSFTKAAKALNITQPAVSQHIHFVEENYGIKLFRFKGKKMSLTEEGMVLLNGLTTIKHDLLFLQRQLKEEKEKKKKLIFGVTLTIGEFVIANQIAPYLHKNPEIEIKIIIANTQELLMRLNSGEIDFALVEGYFEKRQYDSRIYSKEKYIAVCSPKNELELNRKTPCLLQELYKETLIVRESGSGTREILEKNLLERNSSIKEFQKIYQVNNIHVIKELVKKDCGIAFLYEVAVKEELKRGELKEIKMQDFKIEHDFTYIWRKGSIFSEYYKEIFEMLIK